MHYSLLICLAGLLSLGPKKAHAEVLVNVQHAAYAGNTAVGISYVGRSFGVDALYGWTPEHLAGHDVRSMTLKGLWYLFTVGEAKSLNIQPYLGIGAFYSPDEDLFLRLPQQYPQSYYVPSALRPALLTGLRLEIHSDISLSVEYALLDSELAFVRNKLGIAYDKVGSVGFAFHYRFL